MPNIKESTNLFRMCVDAAEYSLNVVATSVDPVIRRSILETYDGNKNEFFTECKFQ